MTKAKTTATATATAPAAAPTLDDDLALMYEAQVAELEAPPASEERPSLHLVEPAPEPEPEPVAEPVAAPEVAPLARTCPKCEAQVAALPGVWSEEHGLCKACAAPLLRKEEAAARKAAKTCACGNWKWADKPLCRDCHEKQRAEQEAARLVCPKCGGKKERHHKVCGSCYRAARPAPLSKPNGKGKPARPEGKVDPKVQAKAAARKQGQELLNALRAEKLEDEFPGAKVKRDNPGDPMVTIAFNGDSYTMLDPTRASALAATRKAKAERHAANKRAKAAAARSGSNQNGKSQKKGK